MATKAAWALATLLVKCEVVENEGVKQYHRTSSLRGKIEPSRCIGESKEIGGFFSFVFYLFLFFNLFLYHIFVVKVQEIAWSASYGENKTQNPNRTNKENFRHQIIFNSTGVRTGPRPTYGREIQTPKLKQTVLTPAEKHKT